MIGQKLKSNNGCSEVETEIPYGKFLHVKKGSLSLFEESSKIYSCVLGKDTRDGPSGERDWIGGLNISEPIKEEVPHIVEMRIESMLSREGKHLVERILTDDHFGYILVVSSS